MALQQGINQYFAKPQPLFRGRVSFLLKQYLTRYISCNTFRFVTVYMNFFTIRDVQNLTGIKAHTLRVWEQRHNILTPRRKQSNHRFYDNEDLKYILRIAFLYHQGYKISRIASLSEEDICRLTLEARPDEDNYGIFLNQLTEAVIDLDEARFEQIFHKMTENTTFEKVVMEILFPLLKKVGHLWLAGNVMPAQEHFASAIIIRKLLVATDELPRPAANTQRRTIVYTPHEELHEIPLLFMQYMLKKNGTHCIYLGSNVNTDTLETICDQFEVLHPDKPVTQLYFHLITHLIKVDLGEYLRKLSNTFPGKEIVFSGTKTNGYIKGGIPKNVRLLKNGEELLAFSKEV